MLFFFGVVEALPKVLYTISPINRYVCFEKFTSDMVTLRLRFELQRN